MVVVEANSRSTKWDFFSVIHSAIDSCITVPNNFASTKLSYTYFIVFLFLDNVIDIVTEIYIDNTIFSSIYFKILLHNILFKSLKINKKCNRLLLVIIVFVLILINTVILQKSCVKNVILF